MPRAFTRIAFTPGVKSAQTRYGSRQANIGFDLEQNPRNTLTAHEASFIAERDSFYQATVSETGWPYVQHRGGPVGFLKVLDERTIGYADLSGNAQYVSVGNLASDDRISLILMDYVNKRRLKLLGRARIVHEHEDPALLARLEVPTYRARVERGVLIHIEACEWNCPQHITPRWTQAQVDTVLAPLSLGDGPLPLRVTGVRQLTPRVRAYELSPAHGQPLPEAAPGAHLALPVRLPDGHTVWRHYSVVGRPAGGRAYEIAVLRDPAGRGGSAGVHAQYQLGTVLHAQPPRQAFALHTDARPAVLVAGGIGITPLRAMALALRARGTPLALHYAARSQADAAYAQELRAELGDALHLYADDQGQRLPLADLLSQADADAVFYACGPSGLLDAIGSAARTLGIAAERLRMERFQADAVSRVREDDRAIELVLQRTGKRLTVAADQTVLGAIEAAGVATPSSCLAGQCGVCAVTVVDGTPDHRDQVLTAEERGPQRRMCVCVSRALGSRLVLDL